MHNSFSRISAHVFFSMKLWKSDDVHLFLIVISQLPEVIKVYEHFQIFEDLILPSI